MELNNRKIPIIHEKKSCRVSVSRISIYDVKINYMKNYFLNIEKSFKIRHFDNIVILNVITCSIIVTWENYKFSI